MKRSLFAGRDGASVTAGAEARVVALSQTDSVLWDELLRTMDHRDAGTEQLRTKVRDSIRKTAMRLRPLRSLLPRGRMTDGDGPLLMSFGVREEVNRAALSGVIAAVHVRDRSRDGDPKAVLPIFNAPDNRRQESPTCCEVDVTDSIAAQDRHWLNIGQQVWMTGPPTGNGLWATSLGYITPRPGDL